MSKTVLIKISYEHNDGYDLAIQEIRETIDALKNSLLSQVSGISVAIEED